MYMYVCVCARARVHHVLVPRTLYNETGGISPREFTVILRKSANLRLGHEQVHSRAQAAKWRSHPSGGTLS